jgi:hypothetical protein
MYAKPSSLLDSQAPNVLVAECGLLLRGTKEGICNRLQKFCYNGENNER